MFPSGEIGASANSHDWFDLLQEFQLESERAVPPTHDHNHIQLCSRAYFKLDEVLGLDERLIQLAQRATSSETRSHVRAIDVGASPGGWVQRLCHFCEKVYGIDPGLLSEDLLEHYGAQIVHVQQKFETFVAEYASSSDNAQFDLLCCDMNVEPEEVAKILLSFESHLKSGALLVLTMKLKKRANHKSVQRKFQQVIKVLEGDFCDFELYWLYANTANERTVVCQRKS